MTGLHLKRQTALTHVIKHAIIVFFDNNRVPSETIVHAYTFFGTEITRTSTAFIMTTSGAQSIKHQDICHPSIQIVVAIFFIDHVIYIIDVDDSSDFSMFLLFHVISSKSVLELLVTDIEQVSIINNKLAINHVYISPTVYMYKYAYQIFNICKH